MIEQTRLNLGYPCRGGFHARGDVLNVAGFMRRYAEHEALHAAEIGSAMRATQREHAQRNG